MRGDFDRKADVFDLALALVETSTRAEQVAGRIDRRTAAGVTVLLPRSTRVLERPEMPNRRQTVRCPISPLRSPDAPPPSRPPQPDGLNQIKDRRLDSRSSITRPGRRSPRSKSRILPPLWSTGRPCHSHMTVAV